MFLGSAPDSYQVNHKNGDRTDNHVENLEWVTCSENAKHSFRVLGRKATPPHGEDNGKSKLTCQEIKKIRQLYAAGKHTHRVLGKMFKVDHSTIGDITRRETWQHIPREEINE